MHEGAIPMLKVGEAAVPSESTPTVGRLGVEPKPC
jgi:hypothetical protein